MSKRRMAGIATIVISVLALRTSDAQENPDFGRVVERHVMIPMRDGVRLSGYLYFPEGGETVDSETTNASADCGGRAWPVVFEQRYADIRGASTRKAAARLAQEGFVVALVNFRGSQ